MYVLMLKKDGKVKQHQKISDVHVDVVVLALALPLALALA